MPAAILTRPFSGNYAFLSVFMLAIFILVTACSNRGDEDNVVLFTNFQAAAVVIGQPDFETRELSDPPDANTLRVPVATAAVYNGRLYVPDGGNLRILVFDEIPASNNVSADLVLGQDSFTSDDEILAANRFGQDVATVVISGGRMFVADRSNHRVLIWDTIPVDPADATIPATVVLGQSDFVSNGFACTENNLFLPESLSVADGRLVVSDSNNHRVLIWNTIPTSNTAPDIVLGQEDFVNCAANRGGSVGGDTLNYPTGIWTDGTRLVVADSENHRVLIWNDFPADQDDIDADVVLGQQTFDDNGINSDGTISANTLYFPFLGVYSNGTQLFIGDRGNHRVLIWDRFPDSNFQAADVVLGQPDFESGLANVIDDDLSNGVEPPTAQSLAQPQGIFLSGRQLIVADMSNRRVLIFNGD